MLYHPHCHILVHGGRIYNQLFKQKSGIIGKACETLNDLNQKGLGVDILHMDNAKENP